MKKSILILLALVSVFAVNARTVYLAPNVWNTDGAKFAIYYFQGEDNGWSNFN